jgi:hypothetical protein
VSASGISRHLGVAAIYPRTIGQYQLVHRFPQ